MGKKITTIYVDEDSLLEASKLGMNLSGEFDKFLMISIGEAKREKELSPEVKEEIDNWVKDIRESSYTNRWQGFLIGRCRLIRNRTGIDLSPDQLETEVNKRLQDAEHNNDSTSTPA